MTVPKISVVLTSYNRLDFLKRAVASVLAQEYPNIEIVITDDCSPDGSWEWIKGQTASPNIIGVQQSKNFGFPTRPRNDGVFLSSGEVISFLDEDNEFFPGRMTSMMAGFRQGVGAVYCHSQGVKDGQFVRVPWVVQPTQFDLNLLTARNYIDLSEVIVRREVLEKIGVFDEKLTWNEEWDLWRRIVAGGNQMLCFPQMWNFYTIHREASRSGIIEIRRAADQRIAQKHKALRRFRLKVEGLWEGETLGQFDQPESQAHQIAVCRNQETRQLEVKTQVA